MRLRKRIAQLEQDMKIHLHIHQTMGEILDTNNQLWINHKELHQSKVLPTLSTAEVPISDRHVESTCVCCGRRTYALAFNGLCVRDCAVHGPEGTDRHQESLGHPV